MTRIRKSYFTLEELASGWGLPEADLRYVAENGLLTLSIRVVGVFMELGYWEEFEDGEPPTSIPCERRYYDGVLDLHKRHVFSLFRDGVVEAAYFRQAMATPRYGGTRTSSPFDRAISWCGMTSCRRFEAEVLPTLRVETTELRRLHDFWHDGRRYRFTPTQAKVLRFLHEAALRGSPGSPARRCSPRSARTRSSSATSSSGGRSGVTLSRPTAAGSIASRSCSLIDAPPERPTGCTPRFSARARRTAGFLIRAAAGDSRAFAEARGRQQGRRRGDRRETASPPTLI